MKKFFLGIFALMTLFVSCKKESNPAANAAPNGTWVVDGTTISARSFSISSSVIDQVAASSAQNDMIQLVFGTTGITTGSYKVVGTIPGTNEVAINVYNSSLAGYSTTGDDNKFATVSITNGKMTVVVPDVDAKNPDKTKTVKISANIHQN